jgi:DNA mismatch repair protein MutL
MEPVRTEANAGEGGVVRLLSDEVINQIAAGEVVERPASVVKELLDNAIDAGATAVTIQCEGGGKTRIRVVDDGCGMSPSDAQRCFERHATSKLRAIAELADLATMGFRGEAMSSIASVSRTTLTTRRRGELAATRVVVHHGRVVSVSQVGGAEGTVVEVDDLFGNVPARLKFLKGEPTESSHVTDVVSRLAMAHPALHVKLQHNGRTVLELPPDRDGLSRACALAGARLGQRLHRATGQEHGISVEAFLAAPELAQTTARGVQLFVGRRAVRDRALLHAVAMGYGELVPRGRYPVAVVLIEAPAGTVDYNVHPQKAEVRFTDAAAVASAVRHVVRAGVSAAPWLGEAPAAATLQMTVRTQAPSAWPPSPAPSTLGASAPSALAYRYAAQLAPEAAQLPFVRAGRGTEGLAPASFPSSSSSSSSFPSSSSSSSSSSAPASSSWSSGARAAEPGLPRWEAATRAVALQRPASAATHATPAPMSEPAAQPDFDAEIPEAVAAAAAQALAGLGAPRSRPVAATDDAAADLPTDPLSTSPVEAAGAGRAADADRLGASRVPLAQPTRAAAASAPGFFSSLRFLGQLQLTYLVCEAAGEMVLIDQHAAHERVAFQRLMERREQRQGVANQRLLFPTTIEVSAQQAALAEEISPLWAQVGYELEPFGKSSIAIKAVPAGMRGADPVQVLRDLLDDWVEAGASRAVESRLENLLATVACHCAVRAGDRLSAEEVAALLQAMDGVDFRAHCPHGRPVLLRLSLDEIARRFGR